jgi:riboflavin kinase / FMN adenylyltransferase
MGVFAWQWQTPVPPACRRGCLTIGNFDGVHRGHAALVRELRTLASTLEVPAVAVTFDPPPLALLRPNPAIRPLSTLTDRCRWLQEAGADHVLILQTQASLLELSANDFFQLLLRQALETQGMVEGPTFGFGRNREGSIDTLRQFCQEASVLLRIASPVTEGDVIISSSRIREALLRGEVENAQRWLGRPHAITGTVREGAKRGRLLGFPTANLEDVPTLVPGDGVYAVRVSHGGKTWAGAANVGPNPTFAEQQRKLEVHLLDFAGDLYGQSLRVAFIARLRETKKFASVDELSQQLEKDVAAARQAVVLPQT